MAEFVHALPLGEHTDHPRRGRLDDLEMQRAGDVPGHRHHHHDDAAAAERSEEHTSELQSLMRISYAVFCLKKKKTNNNKAKHRRNTCNKPTQDELIMHK